MSKVICFHNPSEENGYLSNWYHTCFYVDNILFSSMEQYMMYHKALTFNNVSLANKILSIHDVKYIKQLGREIKNYNETIWNGIRQLIVYKGALEKFTQVDFLKNKLLDTKDDILAECAVNDKIWGIGLSMDDPKRFDLNKWRGQNLLGFTLMKVRETLK